MDGYKKVPTYGDYDFSRRQVIDGQEVPGTVHLHCGRTWTDESAQLIRELEADGWQRLTGTDQKDCLMHCRLFTMDSRDDLTLGWFGSSYPARIPNVRWEYDGPLTVEWVPLVWMWQCQYCFSMLRAPGGAHEKTAAHIRKRLIEEKRAQGWVNMGEIRDWARSEGLAADLTPLVNALVRYGRFIRSKVNHYESVLSPETFEAVKPLLRQGNLKGIKKALGVGKDVQRSDSGCTVCSNDGTHSEVRFASGSVYRFCSRHGQALEVMIDKLADVGSTS